MISIFLIIVGFCSGIPVSIEEVHNVARKEKYFPKMRCVSRKNPDENICPQLYYCIHRGEKIRPSAPVKYPSDCAGLTFFE